ncbi:hydroxyethylthiazole kinase [Oscillibacter valericigenes]|uniref:hydroxyethylthiazole kinase n=1 Tax=Oscillibacter valericigenes TaxID=351091 RepID=UPI001F42C152|nr:hydroxyethylthiazole kinase [Oscillibacter valericigenes]MCF2618077.1 hydroxyethylthiazole kinase [Oscillibacter valericigenes]MDY6097360.1 hydroxyethylthiazole kinase [Oscillospiraceae bacterium]
MDFGKQLSLVRERAPLVQCITNFVTVNDCANIILAAGGSPSMADDVREAAEAVRGSAALVCNLGAIAAVDAMVSAGKTANELGKPVVLDPVAAGNTALRRQESGRLLAGVKFAAIRGNASEIRALARGELTGSGVDVSGEDAVTDATLPRTVETARLLAKQTGAVVAVSGPIDVVTDGGQTILLRNGCATMARITGSGCMLTSLLGAFCGADPGHPFEAACAAIAAMGVAGDLAEERRLRNGTGNATFRTDLIDAVFNLTEEQLNGRVRYEVYEG